MSNVTVIRKSASKIGFASAEEDEEFLHQNFINTDAYEIAGDLKSPQFLLVGRTGAGKSAILEEISKNKENCIKIDPKEFSLRFINNSNLISLYEELDINLDLFYEFLWRHIFSVELLKARYDLYDEARTKSFVDRVLNSISSSRKKAFEYLRNFGAEFWLDIDSRTFEIIQRVEENLAGELGLSKEVLSAKLRAGTKFSKEERQEFAYRAQKILDELRIQELSEVIDWLAYEVFDDDKRPYFILIDDLDQPFAGERVRYSLIKSLIETIKKFRRIRNVRIVAAIRTDLLDTVFEETRSVGFQEEKFESNINLIRWDRVGLKALVDKRLGYLFKSKYMKYNITFDDVFRGKIKDEDLFSYIVSRTLMRPRDIISFINDCLAEADSKSFVGANAVKKAEANFSKKRFKALRDEWIKQYPLLDVYTQFLHGGPYKFPIDAIDSEVIRSQMLDLVVSKDCGKDEVGRYALEKNDDSDSGVIDFLRKVLITLHTVGVVFFRTHSNSEFHSIVTGRSLIEYRDLDPDTIVYVHPMLWQHFNVRVN